MGGRAADWSPMTLATAAAGRVLGRAAGAAGRAAGSPPMTLAPSLEELEAPPSVAICVDHGNHLCKSGTHLATIAQLKNKSL